MWCASLVYGTWCQDMCCSLCYLFLALLCSLCCFLVLMVDLCPMFFCNVDLLTCKHKTHVINNDDSVLSNADVNHIAEKCRLLSAEAKIIGDSRLYRIFSGAGRWKDKYSHHQCRSPYCKTTLLLQFYLAEYNFVKVGIPISALYCPSSLFSSSLGSFCGTSNRLLVYQA